MCVPNKTDGWHTRRKKEEGRKKVSLSLSLILLFPCRTDMEPGPGGGKFGFRRGGSLSYRHFRA